MAVVKRQVPISIFSPDAVLYINTHRAAIDSTIVKTKAGIAAEGSIVIFMHTEWQPVSLMLTGFVGTTAVNGLSSVESVSLWTDHRRQGSAEKIYPSIRQNASHVAHRPFAIFVYKPDSESEIYRCVPDS